jgi:hypothetical protein
VASGGARAAPEQKLTLSPPAAAPAVFFAMEARGKNLFRATPRASIFSPQMNCPITPGNNLQRGMATMAIGCTHEDSIKDVTPSAQGCEECLKTGDSWVHLRLCRTCGHVGCCDDSPNRHATKHFRKTQHPIIEGYDPPEGWGWCYVDEIMVELEPTPQAGPIKRWG